MSAADAFLEAQGWHHAARDALTPDASTRRYTRLTRASGRAILMDDPHGDVLHFARLAAYLNEAGLSAPEVFASAPGLLLIEDFGDDLVARLAEAQPGNEAEYYHTAADVVVHLSRTAPPEGLTDATPDYLRSLIHLLFDPYARAQGQSVPRDAQAEINACLETLLQDISLGPKGLILRDFHAENLIWLPGRKGVRRAGLLDFQDALVGPVLYDLASLLRDARRDVSPAVRQRVIDDVAPRLSMRPDEVLLAVELLSVQRNLRILGIFVRLAETAGKPGYLSLLPRVWNHVLDSLTQPALAPLARLVHRHVPAPRADPKVSIRA